VFQLTRAPRLLTLAGMAVLCASADVSLPPLLISEHMVLAAANADPHMGQGLRRAKLFPSPFVARHAQLSRTIWACWSAYLPPSEAGGPFTLAVSAHQHRLHCAM
jgi:hypothetical protein